MSNKEVSGSYGESEKEDSVFEGKWYTRPDFLILLFVGIPWIIFRWKQPAMTLGTYDFYFFLLILGVWFVNSTTIVLKHKTGQLIADRLHSSTRARPIDLGAYSIFTLGDIDALGITHQGGEGTVIVPRGQYESIGSNNINVLSPLYHIEKIDIPYSIRYEFLERKFPEPYYLGFAEASLIRDLPKIEILINAKMRMNRLVNEQQDFIRDKLKDYETWTGYATRHVKDKIDAKWYHTFKKPRPED